ncbi:MAG: putative porin [Elusimicrobiales bacterium]
MKSKFLILFLMITAVSLKAGEIDILLDRLVEKNVLSGAEAQEIRYETEEEVKKEISRSQHRTLPIWLQNITFGGDLRLRYQNENNFNLSYNRQRFRLRTRLYINAKVNENLFAYTQIATGEKTDPRSTNQTLTDNFAKKNIYLDYSYMEWNLNEILSITAGKIKTPFYSASDMLWDTDINEEAGVIKMEYPVFTNSRFNSNAGMFMLKENSSSKDQTMFYASEVFTYRNDENTFNLKTAFSYYGFLNLKGNPELTDRPSTNHIKSNTVIGSKYLYGYKTATMDLEISKNFERPLSFYINEVRNITLFSTLAKNTAISEDKRNKAWLFGIRVGHEKVSNTGEFNLSYSRRWLEDNAFLDTYPDSDFFGGSTGVKGDELILCYGLGRDFNITFDYYNAKPIKNIKKGEELLQIDLNMKF